MGGRACKFGAISAQLTHQCKWISHSSAALQAGSNNTSQHNGDTNKDARLAHSSSWPGGSAAVVIRLRSLLKATCRKRV